jgi:hypothetical protein
MSDSPIAAGLDPEAVERANAYGPYTHGTWAGRDVAIGNEEALAGRGAFMASQIRRAILERFTLDQIRGMTLVDVGCYDGWLICQLADLPFARLIGIEPRQKNLDKGRMIRQLLGIETRCEFRQGSIETLPATLDGDPADVVICAGLFHHLSSVADGVARLHAICREFLFLETLCLPEAFENDQLREALELKDLPYFFGGQAFGVTGHKLESGYSDGSATRTTVVSLPSIGALRMFLEVQGFHDIKVVADPEAYTEAVPGGWRRFSAVCMTAVPGRTAFDASAWIAEYEEGVVNTLLPVEVTSDLYARYCLNQPPRRSPILARMIVEIMSAAGRPLDAANRKLRRRITDRFALEIVKNLRFAPHDKVALEHGKNLAAAGRSEEAQAVLFRITRRLNADWRSVYRAFCILTWLCRSRGDEAGTSRYEALCLVANPQFPPALLSSSLGQFRLL